MTREEIEDLRQKVGCEAVLETSGFTLDRKESTRRAIKFRRGAEIIIVTHEGRGWFDPLGDSKGDVFSLVSHLDGVAFSEGLERIAALVGFQSSDAEWRKAPKTGEAVASVSERWLSRRRPHPVRAHGDTFALAAFCLRRSSDKQPGTVCCAKDPMAACGPRILTPPAL